MCTFVYVNGLNPETFLDWAKLIRMCDVSDSRYCHMNRLFNYFSEGRYGTSLYAWNVTNERYEFLNGQRRLYNR